MNLASQLITKKKHTKKKKVVGPLPEKLTDLFATDDSVEEHHVDDSGLDETRLDELEQDV